MSPRLDGKVCVITGAAGGIGTETVRRFRAEGAIVAGIDVRSMDTSYEMTITADVSQEDEVASAYETVAERFGRIDVLVNNAGVSPSDDVDALQEPVDVFRRVVDVNLCSVFLCCKYGIPHLIAAGGGSVVNMASFVAVMGSATSQIGYTAAKGGVLALSRELGVQLARSGVRVNALCPGPIATPLLEEVLGHDGAQMARRLVHLPMGRFGTPREIADVAVFLASDEASYITAATMLVDGGLSAAYVTPEGSQ